MPVNGFLVDNTVQKYNYESLENYNTPDFSTSSTYQVGDYVMYQGKLYKCTTAITTSGAWDSTKWSLAILSDDVADLKSALESGQYGLSESAKQALLQIARKVVYVDDQGQVYYNALYNAFYPPADLSSITAVYTQSGTVYDTDALDSLKDDLVVTAHYSDSSTQTVPSTDYTLSGTLTAGTSTITVSYGGKTTTFNVTVTHATVFYTITNNLTGVSNSNDSTRIAEGETYSGTLSADAQGYRPANVIVTVGGTDVTSFVYNSTTNSISVTNVQGDISITASAEEIQIEYGQVYTPQSAFQISGFNLSANINKVEFDLLIEQQTFSGNVMLFSQIPKWFGFTSSKEWKWNNATIQASKTVDEIIGTRTQFSVDLGTGSRSFGVGWNNGTYSCNMTIYSIKCYDSDNNLIGNFVPTAEVGVWKEKISGNSVTAARCENISVVEVT